MIGVVLVGHAYIAQEMKHAVEHILGPQVYMETLNVVSSDAPNALQEQLGEMIRRCNRGSGTLVFADMFGGTPCNIALSFLKLGECEVISGFNLPALVKASGSRMDEGVNLTSLAREVVEAGQQYMCLTSDFMLPQRIPSVAEPIVAAHD
ncbi:MAG: PTS system fructose subfamily IIA component [Mariprofundaceae bacterium]|nr:PTS system fructose subfamily IIA component [Mariprofundaceae bacterium]